MFVIYQVHMWEESPIGTWTLEVNNDGNGVVELKDWRLVFLGTESHPQRLQQGADLGLPTSPGAPAKQNMPSTAAGPSPSANMNQVVPKETSLPPRPIVPSQPAADVTKQTTVAEPLDQKLALKNCVQEASNPTLCEKCSEDFVLMDGKCLHECPKEGYYLGMANHQKSCLPCYYSCKNCEVFSWKKQREPSFFVFLFNAARPPIRPP